MADDEPTREELQAELDRLEAELDELVRDIRSVRDSISDGGPMDPEDRAAALSQVEELEAIQARLRQRREAVLGQLGVAD